MRVRARPDFRSRITDGRLRQGLSPGQEYFVIGPDHEDLRVVDHKGEPILYPKDFFELIDSRLPAGWQFHFDADGGYYLDPVATGSPGFYEDFFFSQPDRR